MSAGLVAVHLYGPLAERYGGRHEFDIGSPAEAVAALDANFPGFLTAFKEADLYYIHADGDWRDGDLAATAPVGREVHFVPEIKGRGQLVALGIGALIPSLYGTLTATIIGHVLVTGLLIGLSFLFKPKAEKQQRDKAKTESYSFSGPENVTEQGVAVPLVYGRVHCGSVVISAGLEVNDEPTKATGGLSLPGGGALHPDNAPDFPGGFPALTGSGSNSHPIGWVIHTTDDEENAIIWKPSPQPVLGWFYWFWKVEKIFSPDGFFVTRGIT